MRKLVFMLILSMVSSAFGLAQDDPFGDLPPGGGGEGEGEVEDDWDSYPDDQGGGTIEQGGGAATCVKFLFGSRCGAIFSPTPAETLNCSEDLCETSSNCTPAGLVQNRSDYSTAVKQSARPAIIGETGTTGTLRRVVCSRKAPCVCKSSPTTYKRCFAGTWSINTTGTPPVHMTYMRWVPPSVVEDCPGLVPPQ
jgi:hypothetical protein